MRAFRRPRIIPPTLADDGPGGRKRIAHVDDYNTGIAPPFKFPGHWTEPDVRGALYAMQGRVCAYCGADIEEAGIDVEHFRPKGNLPDEKSHAGYWWLAYDFNNYLLSCTICNQKIKRTAFPLEEGSERIDYETRARLDEEKRILFDPTTDEVERWIYFDWTSPSSLLEPHPDLGVEEAERVRHVLAFFRLNLKAPQRRKRLELQRLVLQKVDEGKTADVRELAIRFRPHSIVARQILAETAREALPTPEEELEWLVGNLSFDFLAKVDDLKMAESVTDLDEKEAKEYLWALAALWKDPPAGDSSTLAAMLDRRGLKDYVEPYYRLL